MKLYLLTRKDKTDYDEFDSCLVCAVDEKDAVEIHPDDKPFDPTEEYSTWVSDRNLIDCKYIGEADQNIPRGVVISSYNAG